MWGDWGRLRERQERPLSGDAELSARQESAWSAAACDTRPDCFCSASYVAVAEEGQRDQGRG